ncbi:MAG: LPS export ABC transporter periplasmic protein LptC [Pseudomonadota bacterium]
MSLKNVLIYMALVLAAAGSWHLARDRSEPAAAAGAAELPQRGFYLKDARIFGTGPSGELVYQIEAEHAEQVEDQRVDFSNVTLLYAPESRVPWTVNADNASIHNDERRVLLKGHVRALSQGSDDTPGTEIRTEFLELDPDNYTAETDQRVQIRIGERSLTATGMLASLDSNRLELKSNVSGKFFP